MASFQFESVIINWSHHRLSFLCEEMKSLTSLHPAPDYRRKKRKTWAHVMLLQAIRTLLVSVERVLILVLFQVILATFILSGLWRCDDHKAIKWIAVFFLLQTVEWLNCILNCDCNCHCLDKSGINWYFCAIQKLSSSISLRSFIKTTGFVQRSLVWFLPILN